MQRGSAALVIILAVLILVGGTLGLVFLQSSMKKVPIISPTQTTVLPSVQPVEASGGAIQKYQDPELKFEFEYLSDHYTVKPDSEDDYNKRENGNFRKNFAGYIGYEPAVLVKAAAVVSNTDGSFRTAPFTVWVFDNPDGLSAESWFNKYWYYPFNWGQFETAEKRKIAPVNEATVSGELANYGQIQYQDKSPIYYYISKDGRMFLIKVPQDIIGEDILKSFKFTS